MDKLDLTSPDLTARNIDAVAELFPGVVTETRDADGTVRRGIDFDLLRQELSDHVVEGPQERYRLDWPGKRAALLAANAPIRKTLRPVREESVDFDTTKNIFIEGDNLEALKLLQESYLGKVKLIYIDPPYNTGNDFIYNDDFAESTADYLARSGQTDDSGAKLVANTESNGRFHSDWLSMMYPRLKLARNLLRDDGVMFISIDDTEAAGLRMLIDSVFGRQNFIEDYIWESNFRPDNSSRLERENAQHVFGIARNKKSLRSLVGAQKATEGLPSLTKSSMRPTTLQIRPEFVDLTLPDGLYRAGERTSGYVLEDDLEVREGQALAAFRLTGRVIWSQQYLEDQVESGTRIVIKGDGFVPYSKKTSTSLLAPTSLIPRTEVGDVLAANAEIRALFGSVVFNHPKPSSLIHYLLRAATSDSRDAIVLDFFAGSGTTADAVALMNDEDDGSRSYLLVQLPEKIVPSIRSGDRELGTISQLSRERLRLSRQQLGIGSGVPGFRTLRIDSSNRVDVLQSAANVDQFQLDGFIDSVKLDRTGEDLLFQVLLDWGLELNLMIDRQTVDHHEVLIVDDGALIACFAEQVSHAVVREIAARQPLRAVFRDSGFATDAERINAEQIFRQVSPATDVKTI